jgi:hypothetical protein
VAQALVEIINDFGVALHDALQWLGPTPALNPI